jgi:hypothetical protein
MAAAKRLWRAVTQRLINEGTIKEEHRSNPRVMRRLQKLAAMDSITANQQIDTLVAKNADGTVKTMVMHYNGAVGGETTLPSGEIWRGHTRPLARANSDRYFTVGKTVSAASRRAGLQAGDRAYSIRTKQGGNVTVERGKIPD